MEEWKWIKGYEGLYKISSLGRVKSFHKKNDGEILSIKNSQGWYLDFKAVGKKGEKHKTLRIHNEVARAFIGEIPKGYVVHHIDGNKQNNDAKNLQILHPMQHQEKHPSNYIGMNLKNMYGQRHIRQYTMDGFFIAEYANAQIAEHITGVCGRNILQVADKTPFNNKNATRKQAGGYIWKYADEGGDKRCF